MVVRTRKSSGQLRQQAVQDENIPPLPTTSFRKEMTDLKNTEKTPSPTKPRRRALTQTSAPKATDTEAQGSKAVSRKKSRPNRARKAQGRPPSFVSLDANEAGIEEGDVLQAGSTSFSESVPFPTSPDDQEEAEAIEEQLLSSSPIRSPVRSPSKSCTPLESPAPVASTSDNPFVSESACESPTEAEPNLDLDLAETADAESNPTLNLTAAHWNKIHPNRQPHPAQEDTVSKRRRRRKVSGCTPHLALFVISPDPSDPNIPSIPNPLTPQRNTRRHSLFSFFTGEKEITPQKPPIWCQNEIGAHWPKITSPLRSTLAVADRVVS